MKTLKPNLPLVSIKNLCRKHRVTELSIFGSALRDDFRPDSDIDFLVLFESDAHIGFLKLGALENELSDLLQRKVDLVPKDGLKRYIRDEVLSNARIIYAR